MIEMPERDARQTIAARDGVGDDSAFGAIVPPLYLSTSYAFHGFDRPGAYDYTRAGNPTRDQLGTSLARLEGGAGAVIAASGMAAVDLVLGRLEPDDLVLAPHDCYGGTHKLLSLRAAKQQFRVGFVDQGDPVALAAAMDCKPRLVLVETPSNPLLRIVDIRGISDLAKAAGAEVAVDNTFMSPALQRPIALGADFVIHSTAKYLNGHSDVLGGAVIAAKGADVEMLSEWANATGTVGSPFDAYMTLRGLHTLFPRIERQQQSAAVIASFLAAQKHVGVVHYPGLASHPGHTLAKTQQDGFGAMLSFNLNGSRDHIRAFLSSLRVITLADSLGGVESLIAHPATVTHVSMGEDARRAAGIGDNLLRLSVGLEAESDLIADLEKALSAISA